MAHIQDITKNAAFAVALVVPLLCGSEVSKAETRASKIEITWNASIGSAIRNVIALLRLTEIAFPEVTVIIDLLQDWLASQDRQKDDDIEKHLRQINQELTKLPATLAAAIKIALGKARQHDYKTCGFVKYRDAKGRCIDVSRR